jgi:hypothetical protein
MTGGGLCVEPGGGAAKEACESRGQCEVAYGIVTHQETLSSVDLGAMPGTFGIDLLWMAGKNESEI